MAWCCGSCDRLRSPGAYPLQGDPASAAILVVVSHPDHAHQSTTTASHPSGVPLPPMWRRQARVDNRDQLPGSQDPIQLKLLNQGTPPREVACSRGTTNIHSKVLGKFLVLPGDDGRQWPSFHRSFRHPVPFRSTSAGSERRLRIRRCRLQIGDRDEAGQCGADSPACGQSARREQAKQRCKNTGLCRCDSQSFAPTHAESSDLPRTNWRK